VVRAITGRRATPQLGCCKLIVLYRTGDCGNGDTSTGETFSGRTGIIMATISLSCAKASPLPRYGTCACSREELFDVRGGKVVGFFFFFSFSSG